MWDAARLEPIAPGAPTPLAGDVDDIAGKVANGT